MRETSPDLSLSAMGGSFAEGARNSARIMLMNETGAVVIGVGNELAGRVIGAYYVTENARGVGVKGLSVDVDYVTLERGADAAALASTIALQPEAAIIFSGISAYAGYMQGAASSQVIRDGVLQYISPPGYKGELLMMGAKELTR